MHPRDAYSSEPGVILRAHYFFVLSAALLAVTALRLTMLVLLLFALLLFATALLAIVVSAAICRECPVALLKVWKREEKQSAVSRARQQ